MKSFRSIRLSLFSIVLLMASGMAMAAGGSSGGSSGGFSQPVVKKTPAELALSSFKSGLRARDKAWSYLEKAEQASTDKKKQSLHKKADKQFKKAVKRYRSAIKKVPTFYQAHGSLGYALRKLQQHEAALVAYDKSLQLNPDYSEAIEYRAEAHLALGRLAETREAYIQLIRMDRPRADKLMAVIHHWLQSEHAQIDPAAVSDFSSWATERITLSEQTLDLTGAAPRDWPTN